MPIPLRLGSLALTLALASSACVGRAGIQLGGSAGPAGPPSSGGPIAGADDDTPWEAAPGTTERASAGGQAPAPAHAANAGLSDFAFEVKEATGDHYTAWVIDKLTTFEVPSACYAKMIDKQGGAVHTATFYTRAVAGYAKTLTGDDWDALESQNKGDRGRKLVEPLIDGFAKSFHVTVSLADDDCDGSFGALWLKYWGQVATILKSYPPASGKLFIKIAIRGDAKDIGVEVDDATSTYTVTAPRDLEKSGWADRMAKPFKKRARGG